MYHKINLVVMRNVLSSVNAARPSLKDHSSRFACFYHSAHAHISTEHFPKWSIPCFTDPLQTCFNLLDVCALEASTIDQDCLVMSQIVLVGKVNTNILCSDECSNKLNCTAKRTKSNWRNKNTFLSGGILVTHKRYLLLGHAQVFVAKNKH